MSQNTRRNTRFASLLPRLLGIVGLLLLAAASPAETLVGRVVGVRDGDTVTVLDANQRQHKIRLSGIDAPEKGQPFGTRSKEHLSRLAFGKGVAVEWHKRDRYKRMVGKLLMNGQDLNLEQIRAGMAWHFKKYEAEQSLSERIVCANAENEARMARRGLWRDVSPVPPWQFRKQSKT